MSDIPPPLRQSEGHPSVGLGLCMILLAGAFLSGLSVGIIAGATIVKAQAHKLAAEHAP